jgi:hypothetical protein
LSIKVNIDEFAQKLGEWRSGVAALLQRTDKLPQEQQELLMEITEELHVATEELHVAQGGFPHPVKSKLGVVFPYLLTKPICELQFLRSCSLILKFAFGVKKEARHAIHSRVA